MIPIDPAIEGLTFVEYAKNQPQYRGLPARVDEQGVAITCWTLTWRERVKMALLGKFYLTIMTFHQPLQPIKLTMKRPEVS